MILLVRLAGSALITLALVAFGIETFHVPALAPVAALPLFAWFATGEGRVVAFLTPVGALLLGIFLVVVG